MAFTPRLNTDGMKGSKYYYSDNIFYQSNLGPQQTGGNCTWYAWGRFYEINGVYPSGLSTSNATNWYSRTRGYAKGSEPKLGAIACYGYNNGGAGHVAVVEQITSDGIVTSNSGWSSGKYFWTEKCKKSNGYVPSWMSGYLQGFIYPNVDTGTPSFPSDLHWQSITGYEQEYINEKSTNNAYCVANALLPLGWSINAICAMLGNMTIESFISADLYEQGVSVDERGYGLVQWTPAVDTIIPYLNQNCPTWQTDLDANGNCQCQRLNDERNNNPTEWYPNFSSVPQEYRKYQTMDAFATATDDVGYMAKCFVYCYERPADPMATLEDRAKYAQYYFTLLQGYSPTLPTGKGIRTRMPIWMYPCLRR